MAAERLKRRVLIVDDESLNIKFLETLLSAEINVIFANSGEDALSIVKVNKPDLILLDIVMPGMNGYEVCKRLKVDPDTAAIPVIFVTMKDSQEDEAFGLELGAVDYITKPFDPDVVQKKVRNHLVQITKRAETDVEGGSERRKKSGRDRHQEAASDRRRGDRRGNKMPVMALVGLIVLVVLGFIAIQMDLVPPELLGGESAEVAQPAASSGKGAETAAKAPEVQSTQPSQPAAQTQTVAAAPATKTGKQVSLAWVVDTKCPEIPEVEWWRFNTHGAIARYVTRNLNGDWDSYHEKWQERLEKIADIYTRNSTAITNTGIRLNGTDLKEYIVKMRVRVAVIECLAKEAKEYAETRVEENQ